MTRIAHILGGWSQNIGNAFFQLGGEWVLRQALPDARIMLISEQPGYPSYWNPKGGNPANSLDLPSLLEVDYLVLMGPMFRDETEAIWGNALERALSKGTRLVLLGIGAMNYREDSFLQYRRFLQRYPPYILVSRDHETYERLGDLATHACSGIDLGFFMSNVYEPLGFGKDQQRFLALSFDEGPEPRIALDPETPTRRDSDERFCRAFEFEGGTWQASFPRIRTLLARRSRYGMFLEGVLFSGNCIDRIGEFIVLRPDHRPHPIIARRTYRYPHVICSDTPYIYAETYSRAALTLTNRVHACVAALCYGRPAMLFSETPRVRLLDRLGLGEITLHPMTLPKEQLNSEKAGVVAFLKDHLVSQ